MDDDDLDCGDCAVVCCCANSHHSHSSSGSGASAAVFCCCLLLAALALVALLVVAYAFIVPVRVTVDDAALGRLALAAPAPSSCINGTCARTGTAISYDLSVGVALHNHNWAMAVWRRGTLDAELRFRGRTFARARLAGAGRDRIRALRMEVYRLAAAAESAPVALGPGAAAELARQSAAGVFELDLIVFGEVKYEAHTRRRAIRVTCPLRLSPSTATAPAAFARVKCA
ncbi:hypothetical protein GQ55_2G325400 [Panicum hallii var. hallii]|uniref:Late embryogenesis abundant protein LEA-2 subgroup domain-containing protein n=1 Tax=Panicum hallii var. hallii TaxID=1504633 RepID=A0A2T7EUT4_9POAL|nr:hypothetical protein GQ55_2G325400 [Panicum hallii var. hallii]